MIDKTTISKAADMLGIPRRTIQYYIDRGIVPDTEKYIGRGNARVLNKKQLCALKLIDEMSKEGLTLKAIEEKFKRFIGNGLFWNDHIDRPFYVDFSLTHKVNCYQFFYKDLEADK